MAGEGWRRKKTRVSAPPLATWAGDNGLSKRLAGLISDGEATPLVVEIVKRFRATHGATLTSVANAKMMKELDAAGHWGGKRAAPHEASSRPGLRFGLRKSAPRLQVCRGGPWGGALIEV